jgi:hypothetical protein
MYYNPFRYNPYLPSTWYYRTYPPVDVKIFSNSVKSSRLLIQQGSLLLDHLEDAGFARKFMDAAQRGDKMTVNNLLKSIGLKVPVISNYNPSGVIFELRPPPSGQQPVSCCTLMLSIKWRN